MAYVQPHVEGGHCYQPCDPCDPRGGFVHTTPAYSSNGGGYVTYGGPQQPLHSVQAVPPQQRGTVPHTVEYVPVQQATRGYAVQQVQEYDVCGNPVVYDPCAIPCTCAEDDERARRLAADRAAAALAEQATRFESDNTKNMNDLRAKLGLPPTTMLPGSEWDSVSPGNAAKIRELRDRIGVPDGRDVGTRSGSRGGSTLPAKKKFELPEIDFDKLNATLNEPMPTYTPPVEETAASTYEEPPRNYARNIAPPMTFAVSPNAALNTTLPAGAKPQGDYNPYGYPITGQTYNTYAPAPATTQTYTAPPPSPPPRDYTYQDNNNRKLTEWEKWDRREGMNPHMPSPEQLGQSSGDTSSYNRAMGAL